MKLTVSPSHRITVSRTAARVGSARPLVAIALALAAGSCTVGPDYKAPETEAPAAFTGAPAPAPDPSQPQAVPSTPTADAAELSRWWSIFNDPRLAALIDRAIASNLDLQLARSRLVQAREARTIVAAPLYPTADINGSAMRSRTPPGHTGNSFRAGFDASWEIDLFGGTRRAVEAADAQIDVATWDLRSTLVSIIAELATDYYDLRGLQSQLAVARENLAAEEQTATITNQRFQGGFVSGLDYANAQAQVATTRSVIPSLEAQAEQARFAIAILLGEAPEAVGSIAELDATETSFPSTPPRVPVGLPSDLLLRRPDVRSAEAQLHAATANIGVATADLFPRFSLTGAFGLEGSKVSALSSAADRFWSVGPAVSWPIFTAGRIQANIRVQEAVRDQAFVGYRRTVLTALQDVEAALVAYTREQDRRSSLMEAVGANRRAVDLSMTLYTAGKTDFLNVLNAQRSLFSSEDALSRSNAAVITDLVALYKALGGGWEEGTHESEQTPGAKAQ